MKWIRQFLFDPINFIVPRKSFVPMLIAAGATIAGSLMGNKAPKSAAPAKVDIAAETERALDTNIANFDKMSGLTSRTNAFDQAEAIKLMDQVLPGFSNVSKQYMGLVQRDIDAEKSGQLPKEMQDQIFRTAAAGNLATGAQGQAGDFNVARNLGLGALDYQNMLRQRSLNTLQTISGMAPRINPMSTRAMMVTPSQAIQVQQGNEQARYNAQQSSFNAQAAANNAKWKGVMGGIASAAGAFGGAGGLMSSIGSSGGGGASSFAAMGSQGTQFASQTSGLFNKNYGG